MNRESPLVSVVVPSFNQGAFVRDAIDSVLRQTYDNVEIVVVDGGSTDETLDILEDYGPKIRWTSEPDRGIADAINKGFDRSRGDIITWLSTDDAYFRRDAVEIVVDAFRNEPDVDIVFGDSCYVTGSRVILRFRPVPNYRPGQLARANTIAQPAAFMSKDVVEQEVLDEDLAHGFDYEYWLRLEARGFLFKHVRATLAVDRSHPGRGSVASRAEMDAVVSGFVDEYAGEGAWSRTRYFLDRMEHAVHRVAGVIPVMATALSGSEKLAFDAEIDSLPALIRRQLFMSIGTLFREAENHA